MTILVTGATGHVGSHVVAELVRRGADVRALTRDLGKARLPDGVAVVQGDLLDIDAMRAALDGISTLFLLAAVSPEEFTQSLTMLKLAREAGIDRIVYLSAIDSDRYVDVPHMAGKYAAERMIEKTGLHATILRPAYYMNNDAGIKDVVIGHGIYPMPVGDRGVAMIDIRDIAEIAAIELMRRERADAPLPTEILTLVGPDTLDGKTIASIWSEALGRPVADAEAKPADFEQTVRQSGSPWLAYDMASMFERIQSEGMRPGARDVERLETILGRPLRTYRSFVEEITAKPGQD